MYESLLEAINGMFHNKVMLTVKDIQSFLECSEKTIHNWNKRQDAVRRPPRIFVGKEIRFPKQEFVKWLAKEQSSVER